MIRCPNWKALLQHRFDSSLDEPEDWHQALEHLSSCDDCRIDAYEADPTLLFLDFPEVEVDDSEVLRMQQAVTTLRQGLELAKNDSSEQVTFVGSLTQGRHGSSLQGLVSWAERAWTESSWGRLAASLLVAGILAAGAVSTFDSDRPAAPEIAMTETISSEPETEAPPDLSVTDPLSYTASAREAGRFPAMPSAIPANWRDAPVVEEVGGPLARIYNYPTAPDDKIALVMVIDPALDV